MRILIVEPFCGGSHAAWAGGYARHSRHRIEILSLPGRHWKWRMQGGAPELAARYREKLRDGESYDLLLASDMLDLAAFLGLIGPGPRPPVALYFHENQLTYPAPPGRLPAAIRQRPERERWFGFINFTSALAADLLLFNSRYHRESFFRALPGLLNRFPDFRLEQTVAGIKARAEVLYLGLNLQALERRRPAAAAEDPLRPPLILWNHRWDYDKDPEAFCRLLLELLEAGARFEVVLLGAAASKWRPDNLALLEKKLGGRLLHAGYLEDPAAYAAWLWRADLLPVTSRHDFFGISVIEAIHCGVYPLLPDRLAYPEHIPEALRESFLYHDRRQLRERLSERLTTQRKALRQMVAAIPTGHYDWSCQAPLYDRRLAELATAGPAANRERRN